MTNSSPSRHETEIDLEQGSLIDRSPVRIESFLSVALLVAIVGAWWAATAYMTIPKYILPYPFSYRL